MSAERWERIREIFAIAAESEASERRAIVEKLCAGDSEIAVEVRHLLDAHEAAGDFMRAPLSPRLRTHRARTRRRGRRAAHRRVP